MERQGLRSHLSGSVPISIAVHLLVLVVLLVIPLSEVVMPVPADRLPEFISTAPMPPPPPVVTQPTARPPSGPVAQSPAYPITAPHEIPPDSAAPTPITDSIIPDSTGVPGGDVGVIEHLGQPIAVHAPEPPKPSGPVRVAELPVTPRKIVDVRPVYPEIARIAHREGTVIMEAVLDPTGAVTQLRVVRSVPLLDEAALEAVRQWKYTPSVYGGHPVSVLMTITIRFTLSQ